MEMMVTTGAIRRAKLQSYHHHQQTNTQFFTGRMPFLLPNQQCQSTEGKVQHHKQDQLIILYRSLNLYKIINLVFDAELKLLQINLSITWFL